MKILGIDTSGKTASVSVMDGDRIAGEITYVTRLTHSQIILPMVKELLERLEIELCDIDCIAVSEGPGSYTGLRIGIAAVKGICFTENIKCYGVSTLEALAGNVRFFDGIIGVLMHARPGVAYFGAYECKGGKLVAKFEDKVCSLNEIEEFLRGVGGKVMLVGDICEKVKEEIFADLENVVVAPASLKLQRAASLCELAYENVDKWGSCEGLDARYLQVTKAEKDLNKN